MFKNIENAGDHILNTGETLTQRPRLLLLRPRLLLLLHTARRLLEVLGVRPATPMDLVGIVLREHTAAVACRRTVIQDAADEKRLRMQIRLLRQDAPRSSHQKTHPAGLRARALSSLYLDAAPNCRCGPMATPSADRGRAANA